MNSIKKTARIAGLLYLITAITGIFGEYVRSTLIVYGDAAATASNIMASESLFRIGFISDLTMITCYFLTACVLYMLLKPVNKNIALLFVLFTLGSVSVLFINALNQFAALLLLSGAGYLTIFGADQLNALAMLFLNLHKYGYTISQIFFGLWLLPLGYLIFKSGYFPRILGILVMIACFGHLLEFFQIFLFPGYEVIAYPGLVAAMIGEFSLIFWLLIKGAKIPEMKSEN
ncbi:DUF4386 domain-containing protein [bacterium]|nr:DUF4386 domain-containing protein [bacterium]